MIGVAYLELESFEFVILEICKGSALAVWNKGRMWVQIAGVSSLSSALRLVAICRSTGVECDRTSPLVCGVGFGQGWWHWLARGQSTALNQRQAPLAIGMYEIGDLPV